MTELNSQSNNESPPPMLAPCRTLPACISFMWLKMGCQTVFKTPLLSLSFGLFMTVMITGVIMLAYTFGSAWLMFSLLCGFVFIAPLSCIGTYAISAQLERGQTPSFKRAFRAVFKRYIGTLLVFSLVLLIIFLLWARASSIVSIFIPEVSGSEMVVYYLSLASVSLFFLALTFTASVFSLPMIMHRDVDAITAIITSVNAVLRNKLALFIWALTICVGIALGLATGGLFLIFFLPAVGHAVWHGYQESIDASEFSRHQQGITAIAK